MIVGAGLSGLSIGFGLKRQGVGNIAIIDQRPEGREGPWITCARMATLRSPKHLTGPDLGLPSLTFRSWYEATSGREAWERLGKIPPDDWMNYLKWYRRSLDLPVHNETRLTEIGDDGDLLALDLETPTGGERVHCRRIVLATGVDGAGRPHVPELIAAALPRDRYSHSADQIDPGAFGGRDIVVIGAAASAFDWAVAALDNGARTATLLARRPALPKTEALAWANFPGFLGGFVELDDLRRWRFMRRFFALQQPPTQEMFDRATNNPRFRLVLNAPLTGAGIEGGRVFVETEQGPFRCDHVLLGTGYEIDLAQRPELAGFADHIALWRDRFAPPLGEEDSALAGYPYLGPTFELSERETGRAPWLRRIHIFNNGAILSLGPVCNGVTGLKYGAPKIAAGLARSLFLEDADRHLDALMDYEEAHFNAVPPRERRNDRCSPF